MITEPISAEAPATSVNSITPPTRLRVAAFLIDALLNVLIGLPALIFLYTQGLLEFSMEQVYGTITLTVPYILAYIAFSLVSIAILQIYLVYKFGGTIGKLCVGLEVVDQHSLHRASLKQATLRWMMTLLGFILPFSNELSALLQAQRRTLGDRLAETRVIDRRERRMLPPKKRLILFLFLILLFDLSTLYKFVTAPRDLIKNYQWDSERKVLIYTLGAKRAD